MLEIYLNPFEKSVVMWKRMDQLDTVLLDFQEASDKILWLIKLL